MTAALAAPPGVLLGLAPEERRELMRRHGAAIRCFAGTTEDDRLELLRAVVWPTRELVERVREIDRAS